MKSRGPAGWWMLATTLCLGLTAASCAGSSASAPPTSPALTTIPETTPTSDATSTSRTSTASTHSRPPAVTGAGARPSTDLTSAPTSPAGAPDTAVRILAGMSLPQRVGQLIMVGANATGASSSTLSAITNYHVGNVILTGRSTLGTAATAK